MTDEGGQVLDSFRILIGHVHDGVNPGFCFGRVKGRALAINGYDGEAGVVGL